MTALAQAIFFPRYPRASWGVSSSDLTFGVLWLFIAFVSVWDGYLTVLWRHQMQVVELNPMGRALIVLNGGGIAYLLMVKLVGTILAAAWMVVLYERNAKWGLTIATAVAAFQFGLLLFLTFA